MINNWRQRLSHFTANRQIALRLFSVGLGLTYVIAFASLYLQIDVLYGPDGLQPMSLAFEQIRSHLRGSGFWQLPTLFWWGTSPEFLKAVASLGILAGTAYALGLLPPLSALLAWLCYLSFLNAGGRYLSFQWDILLVETGFLAIWLYPLAFWRQQPRLLLILLLWWLNFRLMFASGAVKLLSGDPLWRNFTALYVHYETTCLPNPLSWYAHHLPKWFLRTQTGLTFFVELFLPWLIFLGQRWRTLAALGFIGLQMGIAATGNYTYFNLLSAVLALTLLDDKFFAAKHFKLPACTNGQADPEKNSLRIYPGSTFLRPVYKVFIGVIALVLICNSLVPLSQVLPFAPPNLAKTIYVATQNLRLVGSYGLFANMTKSRPELVIEGSSDGQNWQAYEFKYKPDRLDKTPRQVAPHQPRIEWQLWFAALGEPRRHAWVFTLLNRICQNSSPILELFAYNPFAGQQPQYVRASLYDYRYTTPSERAASGNIWKRTRLGDYGQAVYCMRQ